MQNKLMSFGLVFLKIYKEQTMLFIFQKNNSIDAKMIDLLKVGITQSK